MPLTLYRRGRIWHYRGTVAGRRLRGSTRTQNKAAAQRIVSAKEERQWKSHTDGPAAVLTFADAAILYRKVHKPDRFLREVEDYWKDTPIKMISAGAIRQSAITLYPTAGPATRNRQAIVPTVAIINHAAEHELCAKVRMKRFHVEKKEKTPATWEWVTRFMAAAVRKRARNYRLAGLACFMYLTAARISEALSVEWEDVDFARRRVKIRQTKVGAERWAHMPDELIAALARIPGERTGKVFGFKSRSNCRTQWEGAIRRAGIKRLSFHACRHGFATGLLDKGVNPKTVAERGGWKSAQHVFETYGHDVASETVTDVLVEEIGTPETQTGEYVSIVK
jgi:integrase